MAMIVDANTVVYPRTMTDYISYIRERGLVACLLIVLCDASRAAPAMLTPKRHPYHAMHAEVLLIKLPLGEQLIDDCLLLSKSS